MFFSRQEEMGASAQAQELALDQHVDYSRTLTGGEAEYKGKGADKWVDKGIGSCINPLLLLFSQENRMQVYQLRVQMKEKVWMVQRKMKGCETAA